MKTINNVLFLMIIFFFSMQLKSDQKDQVHSASPTIVNVNVIGSNSSSSSKVKSKTAINTQVQQSAHQENNPRLEFDFKLKLPCHVPNIKEPLDNLFAHSMFCLYEYKWYIIPAALVSSYAYMYHKLHRAKSIIANPASWCNWKAAIPMSSLILTPGQELIHQLKIDINKKYFNFYQDGDTTNMYKVFLTDCTDELNALTTCQKYYNWTRTLYVQKLFANTILNDQIEEKVGRLNFMINLLMHEIVCETKKSV